MKILFIADGRSPTTLNWLRYWIESGYDVHLISSFPCEPPSGLVSFSVLPVAFSKMAGSQVRNVRGSPHKTGSIGRLRERLRLLRYYLGPLSLPYYWTRYHSLVAKIKPDLVHALRIPFEGMLAATTPAEIPLVISTWGNDLTLHAPGSFLMKRQTRASFKRADGLISDTQRDVRLGHEWGFGTGKPTLVVPGSGGIHINEIKKELMSGELPELLPDGPIIVNPRGQRPGSLRQDVFFQAIPMVVDQIRQVAFICPSLRGDVESEFWVDKLGIRKTTKLWPRLSQMQLWTLFKKSLVFVSPSVHDGTPNSLLEAMACGCFPVVGNTESMNEWIQSGVNGFLVDATDANSLALAIIQAINQPVLRKEAARHNHRLIEERAAYLPNMSRVEEFYKNLLLKM